MSKLKIVALESIVDPVDRMDARYGNCMYLKHASGNTIPVYVNNDTRTAWIGNKVFNKGMSTDTKMDVWKFVIALGFKPCFEEVSYV